MSALKGHYHRVKHSIKSKKIPVPYADFDRSFYLAVIIFLVAALGFYWFITHSTLTITTSPQDAIVTINNAPQRSNGVGKVRKILTPGNYSLRIEADGYIAHIETVTLKRAQQKKINVPLKEIPEPFAIAKDGKFLSSGNDFNTVIYLGNEGKTLYQAKLALGNDGNIELKNHAPITDAKLSGIEEVVLSPKKDLALFRKKDGIYLFDFKRYDFINQTETPWGKNIGSVAWAPDNSKIAYYYEPGDGEQSLIFAPLDNSNITRVANFAELNIKNPILRWSPDSEWLLVIPRNTTDYDSNKVYVFNAYNRTIKELTEIGSQIDSIFSPDASKILYATYSKDLRNPVRSLLSVMNKDGTEKRLLELRAEPKKIFWRTDGKNIVVASFDEEKQRESFFNFNLETKAKDGFAINALNQGYVNALMLSEDEKIIIYEAQGGIYALKIE
ncbi:MAG: PEGA domain-containing protein [Patescibacteria group bacterium]|jgi:hypothetical protein